MQIKSTSTSGSKTRKLTNYNSSRKPRTESNQHAAKSAQIGNNRLSLHSGWAEGPYARAKQTTTSHPSLLATLWPGALSPAWHTNKVMIARVNIAPNTHRDCTVKKKCNFKLCLKKRMITYKKKQIYILFEVK